MPGPQPFFPPGHPLASKYIKKRYAEVEPSAPTLPDDFTGAAFVGYVSPASLRFTKQGSLTFEVTVVDQYPGNIDSALELRHLAKQTLPLTMDFSVYEPYARHREQSEARLREATSG